MPGQLARKLALALAPAPLVRARAVKKAGPPVKASRHDHLVFLRFFVSSLYVP